MSDNRGESSGENEFTQSMWDHSARDYKEYLREMSAKQAAAHFKRVAWIEAYQPDAATHCPMCGDTVLELKWSREHTEWQCLEPTCRNNWEWKTR